jgi:NADP-dependent 3-hydroxy acid dehydrogenase YdfG
MSEPRTAVVTGASSGLGAATARALGALGWSVAVGARREDRLAEVARDIERAGGRALAHGLDVASPASIDAFFEAAEKALGPADAVVNNAGMGIPNLLHQADPQDLQREVTTNLLGPLWVARRALPAMLERRRGDLVFVSSEAAVLPRTYQVAYSACKAGVEQVAKVLQMELEGTGVRASVVRPGAAISEFGARYRPEIVGPLLESWRRFGALRELHLMPAERVAQAILSVLTAPPGTHCKLLEVAPETPALNR